MGLVTERMLQPEPEDHSVEVQSRSEKRQITRNRTSYSCQTCRKRKVKCDKGSPVCGGCLKTGDACVYGKLDQSPQPTGRVANSKRRNSGVSNDTGTPTQPRIGAAPGNVIIHGLEQQLARLADVVETMRRESARGAGFNAPPSPESLEYQTSSDDGSRSRQASLAAGAVSDALVQKAGELSQSLSNLDITSSTVSYISKGKENFWSHLAAELQQLQYLIRGPPTLPAEKSLTEAMGLEQHECNAPREKPDPDAVIDECLDMHTFQLPPADSDSIDCLPCHVKTGDKSALLLPRRIKSLQDHTDEVDLLTSVPTEAQSNVLFRAWMSGVYAALPVVPMRITFLRYQRFWKWKRELEDDADNNHESADMYIMPLLFAIWYTGALSLSVKAFQRLFPDTSRAALCAGYHDECVRMLTLVSFPAHTNPYLLASLVMLQSVPCAEEEPQQSSAYVNLMVRLAQSMGIHREPTLKEANPFDAETRRRVWWQVVQLDTYLAVSSGFPTLSNDATADARPVSQVKEMFIASREEEALLKNEKIEPIDDPFGQSLSIGSVAALVMRTYSSIAMATRKIVAMHMRTKPVDIRDLKEMNEIIAATEAEVRAVMNNIPAKGVPELGFIPADTSSRFPAQLDCDTSLEGEPTDAEVTFYTGILTEDMPPNLARFHRQRTAAFHKWARIYLSMMCDKMHCIAYAPFLKNLKSKLWGGGRQCALHHCSAYFRKFLSLANDPSLEPFRWNWPGTAQPMHAAIILLVDLYERPRSVEAPRSRSLIDEVFSLSAPVNGIVGCSLGNTSQRPFREGGGDAWEMLRNLRATAWRKAGLDPDVLWTEEQQVLVGLAQPLTMEQKIARSMREDTLYDNSTPETGDSSMINKTLQGMFSEISTGNHAFQNPSDSQAPQGTYQASPQHPIRLPGQQLMPFPLIKRKATAAASNKQNLSTQHGNGAAAHIDANRFNDSLPTELQDESMGYPRWLNEKISSDGGNVGLPQHSSNGPRSGSSSMPEHQDVATPESYDGHRQPMMAAYRELQHSTTGNGYNNVSIANASSHVSALQPNAIYANYPAPPFPSAATDFAAPVPGCTGQNINNDPSLQFAPPMQQQQQLYSQQQLMSTEFVPPTLTTQQGTDPMDLSFDWEAWDAVFNQYSGYSDFMDDIPSWHQ
jgi:hypothetical protein